MNKNIKRALVILASLLLILFTAVVILIKTEKIAYVGAIEVIDVDCTQKAEILDEVYDNDQRIRKKNVSLSEFGKVDHRNQELVISIIEKCGMPSLKEVTQQQMNAVWLALQHTDSKTRKKYFSFIEQAVKNGDLSKEKYALMKDRILMDQGKAQIYGSQIKNGKLYKLQDPQSVNDRRAEIGMEPIESYLKHFDIKFESNKD